MVLFFIVLLCVSAAGLVSIIVLKRWELSTGRILFGGVRPAAGEALSQALLFIEAKAPRLVRDRAKQLFVRARTTAHRATALGVLITERLLERVLRTLKGATHPSRTESASEFLREVAEHKKSLIKKASRSKKRNVIYDE